MDILSLLCVLFKYSLVELTGNLWEIFYIYKMFLRQHLSHSWAECVTSVQKKK